MPSSYTLGEHYESFVKRQVGSGRYISASEVIRDGLRLLEEQEHLRKSQVAELRRLIKEGAVSGEENTADVVFDRLTRKYRGLAKKRKG